jgi:Protein of unknown function (DUF1348)
MSTRIVPPFTAESALAKVKAAERAWNSRDPEIVAQAYSEDSQWRNRTEFFKGREEIKAFLKAEVGERAGLPADEGALVLYWQPNLGPLRIRVARGKRSVVSHSRQ